MVELVGPALLDDVRSALGDKYPHNDIVKTATGFRVSLGNGSFVVVDIATVNTVIDIANKNVNTAGLLDYIDALPVVPLAET